MDNSRCRFAKGTVWVWNTALFLRECSCSEPWAMRVMRFNKNGRSAKLQRYVKCSACWQLFQPRTASARCPPSWVFWSTTQFNSISIPFSAHLHAQAHTSDPEDVNTSIDGANRFEFSFPCLSAWTETTTSLLYHTFLTLFMGIKFACFFVVYRVNITAQTWLLGHSLQRWP